jgi:hypothetical protein
VGKKRDFVNLESNEQKNQRKDGFKYRTATSDSIAQFASSPSVTDVDDQGFGG